MAHTVARSMASPPLSARQFIGVMLVVVPVSRSVVLVRKAMEAVKIGVVILGRGGKNGSDGVTALE